MKIRKEPIREDRYLNLKLDTYPIDFNAFDSLFYDMGKFAYCIIVNDGETEVFIEYSCSKPEALQKHKKYYESLLLRPPQWFDVRKKKFRYLKYIEEKINDIITIDEKDIYSTFVNDLQQIIVRGSNNGLTFYTKREATDYSRKMAFSIFSGLRVKIGQLKKTSYAELKQSDGKIVDSLIKQTDKQLAERFLNEMYNPSTEQHERWEMFVDLVEAKISEYYRGVNRSTNEAPNYIILEEILKEIDARISISKKLATEEKEKALALKASKAAASPTVKAPEKTPVVASSPTPEKASAPVVNKLENTDSPVLAIKPEEKEKELEEIRTLLSSVSDEKLLEIKALLRSATLDTKQAVLDGSNAVPAVEEHVVPTESSVQNTASPEGKPLPATSADGSKVFSENVPGLFYVDEKCIECDACVGQAPNFFVIENGHAYVFAQPTNDKEIAESKVAMAGCPVDAIHTND